MLSNPQVLDIVILATLTMKRFMENISLPKITTRFLSQVRMELVLTLPGFCEPAFNFKLCSDIDKVQNKFGINNSTSGLYLMLIKNNKVHAISGSLYQHDIP